MSTSIIISEHTVYYKVRKVLTSDSLKKGIMRVEPVCAKDNCLFPSKVEVIRMGLVLHTPVDIPTTTTNCYGYSRPTER